MLLDTSFVIDVLRGAQPALLLRDELESGSEALRIPAIVIYELWEGISRSRYPPRELEIVEETLRSYSIVDLRAEHAMRAGRIAGELGKRGIVLPDADLLIAGIALAEEESLLTRNARDFERIPDLRVRTY